MRGVQGSASRQNVQGAAMINHEITQAWIAGNLTPSPATSTVNAQKEKRQRRRETAARIKLSSILSNAI